MAYWLVKSEPGTWSWDQHAAAGADAWTGVRNHQAKIFLNTMKAGDRALFYHSGDAREVVGVSEVVREAYPDPTDASGKFVCVDLKAVEPLKRPVEPDRDQGRAGALRDGAGQELAAVGAAGHGRGVRSACWRWAGCRPRRSRDFSGLAGTAHAPRVWLRHSRSILMSAPRTGTPFVLTSLAIALMFCAAAAGAARDRRPPRTPAERHRPGRGREPGSCAAPGRGLAGDRRIASAQGLPEHGRGGVEHHHDHQPAQQLDRHALDDEGGDQHRRNAAERQADDDRAGRSRRP